MGIISDIFIQDPKRTNHIIGESIKGLVKIHLDKETVYKKISLLLVEKGYCQWYESEHSYRARHGQKLQQRRKVGNQFIFEGHETKVVQQIDLLDKSTERNTTLTAGSHEYAFKIIIPENIPPSMKTNIGEIKYYLVLKFKKTKKFSWNKKFQTNITIYPSINSSNTDKPLKFNLDKTLTKLFSSYKHKINLKAELDKGFLNPSGKTKISFIATNNSNVTFSVKTELISKTKYKDIYIVKKHMTDDGKTVREVIYSCTVETPSYSENSVSSMFNIIPVAPELCTVRHSKIINREYKLRVTLMLPLPHIKSSIEISVFIGERLEEDKDDIEEVERVPPAYRKTVSEDKSKE